MRLRIPPLEEALVAMGFVSGNGRAGADDALASASYLAAATRSRRRSASGRRTKISRSACVTTASCRSTALAEDSQRDAVRESSGSSGTDPRLSLALGR